MKKFNFLILIIISLIFIIISSKAFSSSKCNLFFDEIKSNYEKYEPYAPKWQFVDFGFQLRKDWNSSKDDWEYYKNNDGFYQIDKIISEELVGLIFSGDLIISANGIDLREEQLDNYENPFEDLFLDYEKDPQKKVEFLIRDKNNNDRKISLSKTQRDLTEPFSDFYVLSIDINEVSKKIDARITTEVSHSYTEEDEIYSAAIEKLYDAEDEENKFTQTCYFNVDDWTNAGFANPAAGIKFDNVHSIDAVNFSSHIELKPYTEDIDWHKDNGWSNELYVSYKEEGVYTFNSNFKYHNFPFDKQTISFEIIGNDDLTQGVLTASSWTKKYLIDFQKKNNITGWNITQNKIKYVLDKGPLDLNHSVKILLEIDIERKSRYYLYKVILPIIIILIVCWSSIYLSPREVESKLTITIVCLLSLIAYNFIVDGEIPKLEYLTIMDWIILSSYFYAALPNILAIYSYNLFKNKKIKLLNKHTSYVKKYGLLSYLIIIFLIITFNINTNSENASSAFSWLSAQ